MLLGLYLLLVIALPLALGSFVAFNGLPCTRRCPACAGDTLRLQSWPHALASRLSRADELHARWCPQCEWRGTTRLAQEPLMLRPLAVRPQVDPTPEPEPEPPSDTIELRRIRLNDDLWRVRVRCWSDEGQWHARLLFLSPSGRSWIEDDSTLTGYSATAVFSRVLSLPDRALSGRIRKATH